MNLAIKRLICVFLVCACAGLSLQELGYVNAPEAFGRQATIRDLLTHGSGLLSGWLGNATAGEAALRRPNDALATYIRNSRIVEIASRKPYDQFLRERLFDPLGMNDTPALQRDFENAIARAVVK